MRSSILAFGIKFGIGICLLALAPISTQAQTFKAFKIAADKALKEKDYHASVFFYGKALEQQPLHLDVLMGHAEAAQAFFAFEIAVKSYEKVIQHDQSNKFPQAFYSLGLCLKSLGQYDLAKERFQAYLKAMPNGPYAAYAQKEIDQCAWAQEATQKMLPFKVSSLGNKVNSDYSDFAPVPAGGDTLYFSSYRFDYPKDTHSPRRKQAKLMSSIKGGRSKALGNQLNAEDKHTAHLAFSLDGQRMYFTICEFVGVAQIRCQLYYREKDKRKRWKTQAQKLPASINMPGFTATQPAIGFDSIAQAEVLYFVSDRPGGQGKLDIWQSKLGKGENKFDDPVNMSAINSAGDDVTPFFHASSQTLYFSSDGHGGFGGFDVFAAQQGVLQKPLGLPINSSYNDLYYVLLPDEKSGYLASNRTGTQYLDAKLKSCCNDIFSFAYVPPPPPVRLDTLSTVVPSQGPSSAPPVSATIPPDKPEPPSKLEDFLPLALYFDNDEPDKRTRRTFTRKDYTATFYPFYERKETYIEAYINGLSPEDQIKAEASMDSFFEDELRKGQEWLLRFAQILHERLQMGDSVEIFIKGFTSPRAESDYNLALGKRRISSLRNFFNAHEGGIFLPFLNSNQLKITERSFGETTARKDVSDDLFDLRNSVFSIGAARERRVEIVEIKTQTGN